MKKIYLLIGIVIATFGFIRAQEALPYSTGFDSAGEQAGWTEYKMGYDGLYSWTFSSVGSYSSTTCLYHDYQVGASSTDTTYDWFVSPQLDLSNSGKIALQLKEFTMMGNMPVDYFGIWFSPGNPDPAVGDYTEIVELTGFSTAGQYKDTSGIEVLSTSPGYIAFVFRSTDNWYTINLDDFVVTTDSTTSIQKLQNKGINCKIYPNPCKDGFTIQSDQLIKELEIFDILGKQVYRQHLNTLKKSLNVSEFEKGIYFVKVNDNKTYKLVVE